MLDTLPFRYVVAVDFEFEFGGHSSFEEAGRSGERAAADLYGSERAAQRTRVAHVA